MADKAVVVCSFEHQNRKHIHDVRGIRVELCSKCERRLQSPNWTIDPRGGWIRWITRPTQVRGSAYGGRGQR